MRIRYVLFLFSTVFALFALGACEISQSRRGDSAKYPREVVYMSGVGKLKSITPNAVLQKKPITFSKPVRNRNWSSAFGNVQNNMPHLFVSDNLSRQWTVDAGAHGSAEIKSTPIVVANVVYVLDTNGYVQAVDAKTGDMLWRKRISLRATGGYGIGIVFSRTNNLIFIVSDDGDVISLTLKGKTKWRVHLGILIDSSVQVYRGKLFFMTADSEIIAMNQKNGEILWRHQGLSGSFGIITYKTPAFFQDSVVVPYQSGHVTALNIENGSVDWDVDFGRQSSPGAVVTIAGSPVISDHHVYIAGYDGPLESINIRTGHVEWFLNIGSVQTMWVSQNYIFVNARNNIVYAIKKDDGDVRWRIDLNEELPKAKGSIWNGPVLAGHHLLLTSSSGYIVSLDPQNGHLVKAWFTGMGSWVEPIISDGYVYVMMRNGFLLALK